MDIDQEIDRLIDIALREDIATGDITSDACIPDDAWTHGALITKQSGTLAGLPYLGQIFHKVDPRIDVELLVEEGSTHKAGAAIAMVEGPARAILSAERTVLNFLQHACGVATMTAAYVRKLAGYECEVMDTRATLPGLRALEKYAVKVAGGTIHRYGLDDRFIIKKNHLALIEDKHPRPIIEAVRCAKAFRPDVQIEVEVNRLEQLDEALQTEVFAIMLDNVSPAQAKRFVKKIHAAKKKAYLQGSAGIGLDTIREYAETGVDGISIGAITQAADNLHISMRLACNREELQVFSAAMATRRK
ncbi:MAG: carboxylating nicotinate-nucleotide diphosphorylase [Chlamydiales bacterium]|nr:carboxylating nicotinate-nucleotide diphosphorylase [Chlamydiales bacterium]